MGNFYGNVRKYLVAFFLISSVFISLSLDGSFAAQASLKKVTFLSINSRAPVLDAGYFVALAKGFYREEGLDVSFEGGTNANTNVELVGQNKAFAASANVYSTMKARLKGIPVISVGVVLQSLAPCIVSLKENPITKPSDLRGKQIAVAAGLVHETLYKTFMKRQHINRKDVVEIMTSETVPLLIAKKVDGCTSADYHAPVFVEMAGLTPVIMSYDDYGMDCYANNILVSEDSVKNNPLLVKAFVKATIRGWEYVFKHQKETIDIILKYNPTAKPQYISMSLERMLPKITSKDTEKFGLLHQTEEKWNQAQDILFDSGEIDKKSDVRLFFTNEFIPKK